MSDRRRAPRKHIDIFFNKYLEGHPYLCRALDVSKSGLLALTHVEPERQADSFPVEIRLPGQDRSLWLWARTVRRTSKRQAIEFVGLRNKEKVRLEKYLSAGLA